MRWAQVPARRASSCRSIWTRSAQQADRANARAVFDLDAPQLKGTVTIAAKPVIAALHGIDLAALGRSEFSLESKLSSGQGRPLLAALGLDRAVTAGDGPAQFEGSVTGVWRAPLRLKVKMSGTGLDAEAEGTAEPWAAEPKASVNLKVRSADLGPLLDLKAIGCAGAEHRPVVARLARGQPADFRRSGQRDSGLAAARPDGAGARRRKERRGRDRPRHARSRAGVCARHWRRGARRRRAARLRVLEGLARPHRVSVAARHAAGRRRIAPVQRRPQRRRPVGDASKRSPAASAAARRAPLSRRGRPATALP